MEFKSQKALDHEYTHRQGRAEPNNLRDQIAVKEGMRTWPIPTASEKSGINPKTGRGSGLSKHAKMFPTPSANEDAAGTPQGKMQRMLGNCEEVRHTGTGTLNPTWVEWLMGFPLEWTA